MWKRFRCCTRASGYNTSRMTGARKRACSVSFINGHRFDAGFRTANAAPRVVVDAVCRSRDAGARRTSSLSVDHVTHTTSRDIRARLPAHLSRARERCLESRERCRVIMPRGCSGFFDLTCLGQHDIIKDDILSVSLQTAEGSVFSTSTRLSPHISIRSFTRSILHRYASIRSHASNK